MDTTNETQSSKEEMKKIAEIVMNTPKSKRRCLAGDHPRDKVFIYTTVTDPKLQEEIAKGNTVVGCSACHRTFVKKAVTSN